MSGVFSLSSNYKLSTLDFEQDTRLCEQRTSNRELESLRRLGTACEADDVLRRFMIERCAGKVSIKVDSVESCQFHFGVQLLVFPRAQLGRIDIVHPAVIDTAEVDDVKPDLVAFKVIETEVEMFALRET